MRILVADRLSKQHDDWSIGWELFYAFNQSYKDIECYIAGKNCPIHEQDIARIAKNFDCIIITENNPYAEDCWEWWDWSLIDTKKIFWQLDDRNRYSWLKSSKIDSVALADKSLIEDYYGLNRFYCPFGFLENRYRRSFANSQKVGYLDNTISKYDFLDFLDEHMNIVVEEPESCFFNCIAAFGAGRMVYPKRIDKLGVYIPSELMWESKDELTSKLDKDSEYQDTDRSSFWDRFSMKKRCELFLASIRNY